MPFSTFLRMLEHGYASKGIRAPAGPDGDAAGGAGGGSADADSGGNGNDNEGGAEGGADDDPGENPGDGDDPGENPGDGDGDSDKGGKADPSNTPTDNEAKLLKDVMKHKARSKELQDRFNTTESELKKIKDLMGDLSEEELADILQNRKDQAREDMEKRGEYDRIIEQMREENSKEVDKYKVQAETLQTENESLQKQIDELTIGRSFSDSSFISDSVTVPLSFIRKEFSPHFDLVAGEVVAFDKPRGAAERTPLVDAQGQNLDFEAAIEKLVSSHPDSKQMRRAKVRPGANSATDKSKGADAEKADKAENLHGQSRIELALKNQ